MDMTMTEGNIFRQLLLFSLPLLAGNFFQQCYNTVDSIVLGNFVGRSALAAVGTTTPIINTLIGLFLGLSTGIGVVISQFYGAREDKKVSQAVQTSLLLVLLLCVAFTIVGVLMVPFMLRLMATPADVLPEATLYLRIYFAGVAGLMLYNLGSGILRAVGDSRRPLYFLIFSAAVNTVLDLLFVAVFHWGIAGAAIATVIAQALSAVLVLVVLTRTQGRLPHRVEGNADGQGHPAKHVLDRHPFCPAAGHHLLLQRVCAVLCEPVCLLLHGRVGGLSED